MSRKSFSSELKSKVAIEAIKGHKTISELASEFGIHTTQINTWKKQLLASCSQLFSRNSALETKSLEEERERLYAQIGKLQVQLDWLKKKTGHLG